MTKRRIKRGFFFSAEGRVIPWDTLKQTTFAFGVLQAPLFTPLTLSSSFAARSEAICAGHQFLVENLTWSCPISESITFCIFIFLDHPLFPGPVRTLTDESQLIQDTTNGIKCVTDIPLSPPKNISNKNNRRALSFVKSGISNEAIIGQDT